MIDFETAKTVAAFGGLSLGVINLGLALYKEFFRKARLYVEIESARICCRNVGVFDFQIVFSLQASKGSVYLREVELQHEKNVIGPYNPTNKLVMNRLSPHTRIDLLKLNSDQFKAKVQEMMETAELVRDLKIDEGQRRSFTISDRFQSEHIMNDWQEIPRVDWRISIDHGGCKETVTFDLIPQGSNLNEFRE